MSVLSNFFLKKPVDKVKNIAIIAHVDHGKTTLTDNLLGEVGMISKDLVGQQLLTDYDQEQKKRGITINSSAVSFFYQDHLINLIDSPGHADFNSQVTSALRSVDGGILLVDSIEGIKTQTETVLGQAIKENVQLVLFINKIDRIVGELKLDAKQVYAKIEKTVNEVNQLVKRLTETTEPYFSLTKNVVFGSALYKWGMTIDTLKQKNMRFGQLLQKIGKKEDLSQQFNLARILLDRCIQVFPSPYVFQKQKLYRIYKSADSEALYNQLPEDLKEGSIEGPFRAIVTDVNYDRYSGLMYTLRVLSGSFDKKQTLYCSKDNFTDPFKSPTRILVSIIKKFEQVPLCFSGTVVVFQGCGDLEVGDTVSTDNIQKVQIPGLKYSREAVVSMAIGPKTVSQMKKMIESVKLLVLEDPSLAFEYDEESKEFTLSGVGTLHLEVSINKLKNNYGVEVISAPPVVSYSETLQDYKPTEQVAVRTPNKHNDFKLYLFKLPDQLSGKLLRGQVSAKNLPTEVHKAGLEKDLAKKATKILNEGCVYFDDTHGASFMDQCKDNIARAMNLSLSSGIKLKKPFKGIGFVLTFAKIHEDNLHRGYVQLRSAFRTGLEQIFKKKSTVITEPVMEVLVDTPYKYSSVIVNQINSRRGTYEQSLDSDLAEYIRLKCAVPLAQLLDFTPKLMSLSEGRAVFQMKLRQYRIVPEAITNRILKKS